MHLKVIFLILDALDFIKKALVFNPENRLTIDEALKHPYVSRFKCLEEELVIGKIISIPMDENTKFRIKDYREGLY